VLLKSPGRSSPAPPDPGQLAAPGQVGTIGRSRRSSAAPIHGYPKFQPWCCPAKVREARGQGGRRSAPGEPVPARTKLPAGPPLQGRRQPRSDPHERARGCRHNPASAGSGAWTGGAAPEPQLLPNSPKVEGNDSYASGSMPVAGEWIQAVGTGQSTQQHILTLAHG
jgi:hypothetical protein